jgi:hypothetical protein
MYIKAESSSSGLRFASSRPDVGYGSSLAYSPPLWDDGGDAQTDEGVHIEPDWDLAAQPAPDYEVDQRINW